MVAFTNIVCEQIKLIQLNLIFENQIYMYLKLEKRLEWAVLFAKLYLSLLKFR